MEWVPAFLSFQLMAWGVVIGCGLAVILYLFVWDTGPVGKGVVVLLYVVSWLLDPIFKLDESGIPPWDFYLQLGLCFYFAIYYKLKDLPL